MLYTYIYIYIHTYIYFIILTYTSMLLTNSASKTQYLRHIEIKILYFHVILCFTVIFNVRKLRLRL